MKRELCVFLFEKKRKFLLIFIVFTTILLFLWKEKGIGNVRAEAENAIMVTIGNKNVAKADYSMTKGEKATLKVSVFNNEKQRISFYSKNKKIAAVNKKGIVVAKKKGAAKIRITITDQKQEKKSTWLNIIVTTKEKQSEQHILIAYFSQERIVGEEADAISQATPSVGNTASAAREIQKQTGGDIFEIVTEKSYPVSHSKCSKIAEQEMKEEERPALTTHIEDMDKYDTIFVGYPVWWYQEPMAVRTFLEEYDFNGKKIVPFCTSLGAGISKSEKNIAEICPNAEIADGLSIDTEFEDISKEVSKWLKKIGIM